MPTFRNSLAGTSPPSEASPAQQALWWAAKGEWDKAHALSQDHEGDPAADWVHAHLHRVEGDDANAAYWYRRAGQPIAQVSLDDEWDAIAASLAAT